MSLEFVPAPPQGESLLPKPAKHAVDATVVLLQFCAYLSAHLQIEET